MKFLDGFLIFLIIVSAIFESVQAQDQPGFISLDCGLVPNNQTYTENTTRIRYQSDANYIETGSVHRINSTFQTQFLQPNLILRSFPETPRNCYNFKLTRNRRYLIRGTFVYGNYDGLNQLPRFDLYIGPNKWTDVTILNLTSLVVHEIIHILTQDRLQICLVKIGETTPFISSLELRPVVNINNSYVTQSGSLKLFQRIYFPRDPLTIRYADDIYDRIWEPLILNQTVPLNTNLTVDTSNSYTVPHAIAQTAATSSNASQPLHFGWSFNDTNTQSYIYMHFAEIQNLTATNDTREFNITYNGGDLWFMFLRPPTLSVTTIFNPRAVSSPNGRFDFTLMMTGNSTLPPIINALEVYTVLNLLELETDQNEVSAMINIKTTYGLRNKINWQGDPCVPKDYLWEGVDCRYPDSEPPVITSLNLTESNLTGDITSEISKLTQLTTLDLSKNNLTGLIPDFFAQMELLKLINLTGNPNLNHSIPESLMRRVNSNSLRLIVDEIPKKTGDKKSKGVPVAAIVAPVVGVILLLVILIIFFVVRRRKPKSSKEVQTQTSETINSEPRTSNLAIGTKDRKFTYSEILKMTKNFERVLGKGGFGTVYYGSFDDTQVAVKMLSHSSAQGYKQFKAEVELLLRVHHRHLVGLVGYCDDGDNLALIYEYMANGDLREHMSGKRGGNVLSWENRMQIAVEAAQGLEYLHNGCRPPMVHRDVKTSNILLNERSQAKLADFGLSRSFPVDGESTVMTAVAGTPGYLDPEYYKTNWLSEKSDVYSFGIVLLEIITNQAVIDKARVRPHITEWVGYMLTKGDIRNIVDPKLMNDYDTNGVWKVIELAMRCVNPTANSRPAMPRVVMELNECLGFEIERKQSGQERDVQSSVEFSVSHASDFVPRPR